MLHFEYVSMIDLFLIYISYEDSHGRRIVLIDTRGI
jgi:hypothetical protein